MKHITHHYEPQQEYPDLYVINMNFGGNEMHESSVRLVVKDVLDPKEIDLTAFPIGGCHQRIRDDRLHQIFDTSPFL